MRHDSRVLLIMTSVDSGVDSADASADAPVAIRSDNCCASSLIPAAVEGECITICTARSHLSGINGLGSSIWNQQCWINSTLFAGIHKAQESSDLTTITLTNMPE
jgi:hypothetical protein